MFEFNIVKYMKNKHIIMDNIQYHFLLLLY